MEKYVLWEVYGATAVWPMLVPASATLPPVWPGVKAVPLAAFEGDGPAVAALRAWLVRQRPGSDAALAFFAGRPGSA
jgi:hypothetical protein